MSSTALGKKEYFLLGKLLTQRHPEMAKALLPQIPPDAREVNFKKMPCFYNSFCNHMNVDPAEYKGPLHTQVKLEVRRLFISTMLHMYVPEVFCHPLDGPIIPSGFSKSMCIILGMWKGQMSETIREVIIAEKAYDDYKAKVDQALSKLSAVPENK